MTKKAKTGDDVPGKACISSGSIIIIIEKVGRC